MEGLKAGRALVQRANDLAMIGRRFAAAREAAGMRPVELAHNTGIAENTISQWEGGTRRPSIDQLLLALPVLAITMDWIYFGDDSGIAWQTRERILSAMDALPIANSSRAAIKRSGT
jgi:transcriptional regulator with XRE-family HTH domain